MTLTESSGSGMSPSIRAKVERYSAEISSIAKDQLVSVAIFGAAVTRDWRPSWPIHHVIVTSTDDLGLITELGRGLRRQAIKIGLSAPLLVTKEMIASSLDTFPLEWLEIRTCHETVGGTDVFNSLTCEREPLRLQCERESLTIAMTLRQRALSLGSGNMPLADLAEQAVRVARGLIYLTTGSSLAAPSDVIASASTSLSINLQPIIAAWNGEVGTEATSRMYEALTQLGKKSDRA